MASYHTEITNTQYENETLLLKILNMLCYINLDNNIVLNYQYFKFIGNSKTYTVLIQHIVNVFEKCLSSQPTLKIHLYIKTVTLADINKHLTFIKLFTETLKMKFPDKLEKCFIYDPSFIFSQIYGIISKFIDKPTLQKIEVIKNS